jgi:rhomboid protease GluP
LQQIADYLLVTPVILAMVAGQLMASRGRFPRPGPVTLAVFTMVALGLAVQLAIPGTLELFRRDATAIAHGEAWRLVTSLFVQDGGLIGGLFNLSWLFLAGGLAERIWNRAAWLGLYFGGGLICELIALSWEPVGGGNSIAYFSLCGSILALPLRLDSDRRVRVLASVGIAIGVVLTLAANIHGAALLLGVAGGLVLAPAASVREDGKSRRVA